MKNLILAVFIALSLSLNAFATVNINTATKAELQTLKGIGANKADAIIQYRKDHGNFKSVNDLSHVKGLGPKIIKKIMKDATVSGKTTLNSKEMAKKDAKKASKK
ncbi:MAG: helix-hairpin-helix domain-containing protein [Methylophilaceae bacterium]|nr:helix-hairpin-helix domain-containing protein [Methylophilaceae bacterium]